MASRPINVDHDFLTTGQAINLRAPSAAGDAATKAYVDSAVEGLAWKDSARVATQSNINLAAPGATIDGITMAAGDRVLVGNQTTASQNGIYVWNGAAVAATRALDASTAAELEQAVITVEEGTAAGATYRQTSINFTLDTGAVAWTAFGTSVASASEGTAGTVELATQTETDTGTDDARAITPLKLATWSGRPKRYSTLIGDGSATSYTVTHNLNSQDVVVSVREAGGSLRLVETEARAATLNSVTILVNAAPATNAYRVTVLA